jgi:DNA-directed RNA polymerase subunit beta'
MQRGVAFRFALTTCWFQRKKQFCSLLRKEKLKKSKMQYTSGLVTQGERYNKVVDIWGRAGDQVAKAMMEQLSKEQVVDREGNTVQQESFNCHLHDG